VGKPQVKNLLRRLRHGLLSNVNINFRDTEWSGMNWICQDSYQLRAVVNTVMNLVVPQNS
jgi:hypothetical protein